jgi:hypothetical protein
MMTRQWLALGAMNVGELLMGVALAADALFGDPHNRALVAVGGGIMIAVTAFVLRRLVFPNLARARWIDNHYIPAPCHMGTFGWIVHVNEYCRCRQGVR